MRVGWSKKTMNEIATITMGQSPSGNSINETEGIEFHQGKIYFGEKYINESHFYTSEPLRIAEPNSLLLCVRAPIGVVNMTARKICIGRGLCSIKANDSIHPNYLYYALLSQKDYFDKNATGSTFLAISSNVVKDTQISFPSKDKQIQIASELDMITEMISKYDEQLKELDKLSQSIFNEMFGDPVENEKGWEVKKLGEICLIERGGSPRPIKDYITDNADGLNWVKIGDAIEGSIFINSTKQRIKKEGLKKTRLVHKGDFILSNSMSFGRPYIMGIDGCIHDGWLVLHDKNNTFDKLYLYYMLANQSMYQKFKLMAVGGVVNNLNSEMLRNVLILIPPLPLQQSFARKIEAIEAMKSKVKEAKKEAETLLAARMQYWFE